MNTESLHPFLVWAKAFCEQEDQDLASYEPAFLARSEKNLTRMTKSGCGFKPKNKLTTKKLYEPSVLQNPFLWAIAGGPLCLTANNYLRRNWKSDSVVYPFSCKLSDQEDPFLTVIEKSIIGQMKTKGVPRTDYANWRDSNVTLIFTEDSFPKIITKFERNFIYNNGRTQRPSMSIMEDTILKKSVLYIQSMMYDISYNKKNGNCLVKIPAAPELQNYKEDMETYFLTEKISDKLLKFLSLRQKGLKMPVLEDKEEKTELKFEIKPPVEKQLHCRPKIWNPVVNPYPVKNPKYFEGKAFMCQRNNTKKYIFSYGCSAFYLTVDEEKNKKLEIGYPYEYLEILALKEWEEHKGVDKKETNKKSKFQAEHNGVDKKETKEGSKFKAGVVVDWAKSVMEKHTEVDEFDVAHQFLEVRLQQAATTQQEKEAGHVDEAGVLSVQASRNLSASDKTPQENSMDFLDETKSTDGSEAVGGASGTPSQIFSKPTSPSRPLPTSTDTSAQNGFEGQKLDLEYCILDLLKDFHANGTDTELEALPLSGENARNFNRAVTRPESKKIWF